MGSEFRTKRCMMAKHRGRISALTCGAEGCTEVPTLGSNYCVRHHEENRRVVRKPAPWIWLWLVLAGVALAWLGLTVMNIFGLG